MSVAIIGFCNQWRKREDSDLEETFKICIVCILNWSGLPFLALRMGPMEMMYTKHYRSAWYVTPIPVIITHTVINNYNTGLSNPPLPGVLGGGLSQCTLKESLGVGKSNQSHTVFLSLVEISCPTRTKAATPYMLRIQNWTQQGKGDLWLKLHTHVIGICLEHCKNDLHFSHREFWLWKKKTLSYVFVKIVCFT